MGDKFLEKRFKVFFILAILFVITIVGRLWFLQIVRGEHFARLADGNRMRQIRLTPSRGIIYDTNGDVLVRSRPAFTVSLVPGGVPNESEVLDRLAELLGLERSALEEAINRGRGFPYEPVRIVRDVDPALVVAIEENRMDLPGVFIEEEPVREYLHGGLASHVLGYLGIIDERELQEFGVAYRGSDLVGKSGIERLLERELRGLDGALTVEVNALSRPIQTVNTSEPIPGYNVTLTIDHRLQEAAEQAFLAHTAAIRENAPDAFNGAVIAMRPQTGEILAMVSIPGYEPDRLMEVSERNAYYRSLVGDSNLPFFNRVTQGQYGPGSSFKPVTATAILEEGVYGANEVFNATGTSRYGVRDWVITSGLAPLGPITMTEAIAISSNHYFAEQGVKLGIDNLAKWMREFGFGSPTGLAMVPSEARGTVPDRDWKRQRFANRASSEQVWYPSDTEQLSIGQGFHSITPLQMAVAYSTVANRGKVYEPTLIKEVLTPQGELVQKLEPVLVRELDVSNSTWDAVIKGLRGTISLQRGTGRTAFAGTDYNAVGKTGTYEIPGSVSHGLFGGFAPMDDPELVVFVVVEHGGGGASAAAPIARMVFDAYFGLEKAEQ